MEIGIDGFAARPADLSGNDPKRMKALSHLIHRIVAADDVN
jgi:hypothetical protein